MGREHHVDLAEDVKRRSNANEPVGQRVDFEGWSLGMSKLRSSRQTEPRLLHELFIPTEQRDVRGGSTALDGTGRIQRCHVEP